MLAGADESAELICAEVEDAPFVVTVLQAVVAHWVRLVGTPPITPGVHWLKRFGASTPEASESLVQNIGADGKHY